VAIASTIDRPFNDGESRCVRSPDEKLALLKTRTGLKVAVALPT
jgi:hypothetical protein